MVSCTRGCGFQECSRQVCSLHPYPAYSPWSYFPWRGEFLVSPPQTWVDLSDCLTSSVQQKWCHVILSISRSPEIQKTAHKHPSTLRPPYYEKAPLSLWKYHSKVPSSRERTVSSHHPAKPFRNSFFFFLNVYLFGYTWSYGSMWDLCSFLWHVGSLVLAWEFLVAV